jgi:hypothetical protein
MVVLRASGSAAHASVAATITDADVTTAGHTLNALLHTCTTTANTFVGSVAAATIATICIASYMLLLLRVQVLPLRALLRPVLLLHVLLLHILLLHVLLLHVLVLPVLLLPELLQHVPLLLRMLCRTYHTFTSAASIGAAATDLACCVAVPAGAGAGARGCSPCCCICRCYLCYRLPPMPPALLL